MGQFQRWHSEVDGRFGVLCHFSSCTIWHRLENRRYKYEGIFDVPSSQRIVPLSEEATVIPWKH